MPYNPSDNVTYKWIGHIPSKLCPGNPEIGVVRLK
jgi:hypothetical protein